MRGLRREECVRVSVRGGVSKGESDMKRDFVCVCEVGWCL